MIQVLSPALNTSKAIFFPKFRKGNVVKNSCKLLRIGIFVTALVVPRTFSPIQRLAS